MRNMTYRHEEDDILWQVSKIHALNQGKWLNHTRSDERCTSARCGIYKEYEMRGLHRGHSLCHLSGYVFQQWHELLTTTFGDDDGEAIVTPSIPPRGISKAAEAIRICWWLVVEIVNFDINLWERKVSGVHGNDLPYQPGLSEEILNIDRHWQRGEQHPSQREFTGYWWLGFRIVFSLDVDFLFNWTCLVVKISPQTGTY